MEERTNDGGRLWRILVVLLVSAVGVAMDAAPAMGQDGGSRDSAVPLGETGSVGDYEITVLEVVPDATDQILAENQFNEAPAEGNQFFLVRLGVTYTGDASGTPAIDLNFNAVGASNVGYTTFQDSCGVLPDDAMATGELFAGGHIEFNVCWQVTASDAGSLVMYVEDFVNFDAEDTWFSLGLGTVAATPTDDLKAQLGESDVVTESSRNEPIPFGGTGQVGSFQITVDAVEPLADELVEAENEFNEPPAAGNQVFMITVTVTNVGSEATAPWLDLNFQAVGDAGVGYTEFDNSCGVIPSGGMNVGDVFPGGTVTFNVCWQIASDDADSLVMYVDPLFSFDDSERAWFSLRES